MSNIQKWSGFSLEDAREEEKALAEMNKGKFHKLKDGKNRLRFLPAKVGGRTFLKVHQHFVKVGDMEGTAMFNCPRRMASQPCIVCSDAEYLGGTGSTADYDVAGKMFAQFKVFANVIDRDNPDVGPVTLAMGKTIYEAIVKIRSDENDGGDFTDPEEGFDIIVTKSGTGLNTKYEVRPSMKGNTPLGDLTWIDIQPDLTRLARVPNARELEEILARAKYRSATGGGARVVSPAGGRNVANTGDDD